MFQVEACITVRKFDLFMVRRIVCAIVERDGMDLVPGDGLKIPPTSLPGVGFLSVM